MTDTDIKDEVIKTIDGHNERMPATWIVQAVLSLHVKPKGKDKDFYLCCAYGHVRAVVRQTLQRMRGEEIEEHSDQLILPGFERLQQRYIIEHDGELLAVPLEQMTQDEIRQKIEELHRMARGCLTHARELERYLSNFGSQAA
jgi:hypothetical protein